MFDYEDIFNQRANLYHEAMINYPQAREEEFKLLLELLNAKNGETILDIPSGSGYLKDKLPKNVNLFSIDPSSKFCDFKEDNKIINSSILDTPFEDKFFDKIFSLSGLHHLKDKNLFFKEAFRLLKSNGTLAIADVAVNTKTAIFLNEFIDSVNPQGHKGLFLNTSTIKELENEGFIVSSNIKKLKWNFTNIEAMAHFCTLLFGANCHKDYMKKSLKTYLNLNEFKKGISLEWELLFIKAIKAQNSFTKTQLI